MKIRRILVLIFFCSLFMIYLNLRKIPSENHFNINEEEKNSLKKQLVDSKNIINNVNTKSLIPNMTVSAKEINVLKQKMEEMKHSSKKVVHPFMDVFKFRSNWKKTPYKLDTKVDLFETWEEGKDVVCEGKVSLYNQNFLHSTSMLLDRTKAKSVNMGGEDIKSVILQDEKKEFYEYEIGFILTQCLNRFSYFFEATNHLNEWLTNTLTKTSSWNPQNIEKHFTIAIVRYEYANLFHTLTDWYNAFLIKDFFNKTSFQTNILIIDTHPEGMLDTVWSYLFNHTTRLSNLPATTLFTDLAWGILGYNSPLKIVWSEPKLPLVEEFRTFFFDAFNVSHQRRIDCSQIKILIIWRRDFLAHPRNPNGTVSRKIANEAELLNYLRKNLPPTKFLIKASQIDLFSMSTQLQMVAWADILVGMHGAGLTHAIFLNPSSALIELQPNYYQGTHFEAIAKWRGLKYAQWRNTDDLNELPNKSTIIPPSILFTLIKKTSKNLCSLQEYKVLFGIVA